MSKFIGRPKVYGHQIMFALRECDIEELNKLVSESGLSRSEYLRILVVNHLLEKIK